MRAAAARRAPDLARWGAPGKGAGRGRSVCDHDPLCKGVAVKCSVVRATAACSAPGEAKGTLSGWETKMRVVDQRLARSACERVGVPAAPPVGGALPLFNGNRGVGSEEPDSRLRFIGWSVRVSIAPGRGGEHRYGGLPRLRKQRMTMTMAMAVLVK